MNTRIEKVMVIQTSFMQDIEKQPVKGGSVLFMTDVTVFYMTMLRIVTYHMFIYIYICLKTIELVCEHFFCYANLGLIDYFR